MDWIDISVPLRTMLVGWPGDVPVEIARRMDLAQGADYNISMITMSTHAGTHMDAPLHFISGGATIDSMPLDATVGPARVIEIADTSAVTAAELETHDPREGERLLFKTVNSLERWYDLPFREPYVSIGCDAAEFLAARKVRCVGIDYLSVGSTDPAAACETHRTLLEAGVWVIEALYLAEVPPGPCDLVCLPLRVEGAEGAPARAIVRPA